MNRKTASGTMLTLLLIGMLTLAFNIQPVKASETVYIRADGSVEPSTAPISSVDNITYVLTNDIYDSIVVERDNIVVDGAGFTVQGTGGGRGIDLSSRINVTVKNTIIKKCEYGTYLNYASQVTLIDNSITNIWGSGILLSYSSNNNVSGNNIASNWRGITIWYSSNNNIYHSNFIDNTQQVYATPGYPNSWDNDYPSGGNYWSDYTGVDVKSGPNQDLPGSDGIGDTPYVIDENNQDNYPLMEPYSPIPTTVDELKTEIEEFGSERKIDNQGIVRSLIAKLNVAQKLIDSAKVDQAKHILGKAFIQQVQNLSGIHITPEVVDILIESAEHILSIL